MKVLILKPIKGKQDIRSIIGHNSKNHSIETWVVDYSIGGLSEDEKSSITPYAKVIPKDFIDWPSFGLMMWTTGFDVVVGLTENECVLHPDAVDTLLEPLNDPNVNMTYSDFRDSTGDRYHTSSPSKLKDFPLYSIRRSIMSDEVPETVEDDLPSIINEQTLSRHISKALVDIK